MRITCPNCNSPVELTDDRIPEHSDGRIYNERVTVENTGTGDEVIKVATLKVRKLCSWSNAWFAISLVFALLSGCALAGPADSPDARGPNGVDAPTVPDGSEPTDAPRADGPSAIDAAPDAPHADAAIDAAEPVTITLSQVSTTMLGTMSLACYESANNTTAAQGYFRVFDLAALGITTPLTLSSVAFGVQTAEGTQAVTVRVGTYSATPGTTLATGAADWGGDVTPIGSATTSVTASASGTIVSVPLTATIPGSARLIVEIATPDDTSKTNSEIFLGTSSGTETTPGYFYAPDCDDAPPGTPAYEGQPATPFVITATGTYTP